MKKYLTFFAILLLSISAGAENVSLRTATQVASYLFNTTKGGNVSLVWEGGSGTKGSESAFYVFNYDRGGFVIISGDDRVYPILGYSDTGSFVVDDMPSNIRAFFDGYIKEIESVRNSSISQSADVAARWNNLTTPSTIKDLKTALWDQYEPYNDKCPTVDKQKAVTGCVSTATSIVMYYHKWPKSQSGTLPSYSYTTDKGNKRTQEGHDLASAYDWDSMLSSYSKTYTQQAQEAVSTLMFDVGVMLQSHYNGSDGKQTFGTAAYSQDIPLMLIKYMDYDSSAVLKYRDAYSSKEWHNLMRAEVDADRPVMYGGAGGSGGHQFILDGYGDNDFFHINWGWGGEDNGLFRLEALGSGNYVFSYDQDAVLNLKPKTTEGRMAETLLFTYDYSTSKGGLTFVSGTAAKDSTINLSADMVINYNIGSFKEAALGGIHCKTAFCLCDKNGRIKTICRQSPYFDLAAGYYFNETLSWKVTCDVELGDQFRYMYMTTGDWKPVETNYEWYNYSSKGSFVTVSDAVAVYDFPQIKVDPDGYSAGDVLDLRLVNCKYIPTIVWYFDGVEVENGINYVLLTSGKHTVKAVATFYKEKISSGSKISTQTFVRVINVN